MKIEDYFALAMRIIGVLAAGHGIRDLVEFGLLLLGYNDTRAAYAYYLIIGLLYLFAGLYLLRGAPLVLRFAFPKRLDGTSDEVIEDYEQPDELTEHSGESND